MGAFNRTKAKNAEVEAKVNANRCLCDGIEIDGVKVPCNRPPRSRGLCSHHRDIFYYEMSKQPTLEKRAKFEAAQVREGLILLPGEVVAAKRKHRSPFQQVG